MKDQTDNLKVSADRRSFMRKGLAAAGLGAGMLANGLPAFAQQQQMSSGSLTSGDAAVLKFVAAAEIIETDLWQQYTELGGVTTGHQNPYQLAFANLDPDGPQYITSNTGDEQSHANFLNAYLIAMGQEPVDFDRFRTLPSSQAAGAQQIGRLTNLMQLTIEAKDQTTHDHLERVETRPRQVGRITAMSFSPLDSELFGPIFATTTVLKCGTNSQRQTAYTIAPQTAHWTTVAPTFAKTCLFIVIPGTRLRLIP